MTAKAQDLTEFFNAPNRNNLLEYLDHCKKMNYKVYQEEGLVLYGFGLMDDGIPSDVYFLPGKLKKGQTFEAFVKETFSNKENMLYEMIFAPLRMRNPKLAAIIDSMEYDIVGFSPLNKFRSAKISYCRITFNLFYGDTSRTYPASSKISDLMINYRDQEYVIKFRQLPDSWGRPVYFEKLDLMQGN
ncbi:hypothetical protein SAMN05421821_117140 [Mucilaginibacter lappiensis]|uniref:Uncharacterized protein n=1 Tax=Mucilaginibacter lappiensis TaxID=354630 RepID=A0ABR6PR02_9SPHI|nr:hypothetical protein [Mucilaginibacter lappiensis]MBB6112205.1 hypothetical protein [Mucilaginibacter lappiensis]SIR98865.1 hypothetical protein SAMN05421821_117140 [Mucilaginibacter lappiensis]